ncbi:hypothetical protein [Autumnicola psychrophila]|uniref:Restriction endonuclease domain-containing protein n=1 Tax=Autumnicola psychrophila TaxID=3075592 RepID=A0ABU3DTD8_9FLAO|nr:hypothetical protein [Zunongwangia sp. F225]MDT0686987.1 hypothetical protein [Zunongwangia sp. F225]
MSLYFQFVPGASGENSNQFYQNPEVKTSFVSEKAVVRELRLPDYIVYDVVTDKGITYVYKTK